MTALPLTITTAGLSRFTAAQVDDDIDLGITSVGLTDLEFVVAPTLTALPGQFRQVATISGEAVGDNVVHMIVRDAAELSYTVRGFGLFLEDGTLFAVYGQEEPLFEKAAAATMLLAVDMAFPTGNVSSITFGDTNFLNPPATTTKAGVVELATPEEAAAGEDAQRAVTPAALREALVALIGIGHIAIWYGSAETVPAGWAICNGQTIARSDGGGDITTPDLRDRTVIGAGGAHARGDTIGAFSKTVNSTDAGGHTPAGTVPDHAHPFDGTGNAAVAAAGVTIATTTNSLDAGGSSSGIGSVTLNDAGHSHGVTVNGTTQATSLALTMVPVPAHKHGVTIDVTQPSLALHYIMRI